MNIKNRFIFIFLILVSSLVINSLMSKRGYTQTSNEIQRLRSRGVPVILPSYIPQGFRQIDFDFEIVGTPSNDFSNYKALYRGPNNSCYSISGTNGPDGGNDTIIREWVINHQSFGQIRLEEFYGSSISSRLLAIIPRSILGSGVTANYFFYSPTVWLSNCNKISPQEASKIIHSLRFLNP